MDPAENLQGPIKKIKKEKNLVRWKALDNRSRRNNGSLTNNDDSVGTVE